MKDLGFNEKGVLVRSNDEEVELAQINHNTQNNVS